MEQQISVGAGAGGWRAITQLGMQGSGAPCTKRTLFLNTQLHTCHCCAQDQVPLPRAPPVPCTEHMARTAFSGRELYDCLFISPILLLGDDVRQLLFAPR